ncbi:hypothetical protein Pla8534_40600 [Lignipirellula cremea]|uniref:Uncharacterized protein n=1 Tax=Lignipirellula cremea TaxID=2528010 RepID=A0A518DWN5_9BACT|nr:hypothetical protein [Lignipirellula cremea]QDU96241.1 hypothetical protein Pla8534_40600 [Lignipirellula cremea]
MELLVQANGRIRCVYGEAVDVRQLGAVTIERGSHVEPTSDGCWTADLSPVNGPLLGPFAQRSEALAAERNWLEKIWLVLPETLRDTGNPSITGSRC